MPTTDRSLRLALATVPCPECGGDPLTGHQSIPGAKACHGAGRVPWLTGVRVTCVCYGFIHKGENGAEWHKSANGIKAALRKRNPIADCQGRGWTVSEDTEAWLEAARPEMLRRGWVLMPLDDIWMVCTVDNCEFVAEAPTVKEALQLALGKVVPK